MKKPVDKYDDLGMGSKLPTSEPATFEFKIGNLNYVNYFWIGMAIIAFVQLFANGILASLMVLAVAFIFAAVIDFVKTMAES